MLRSDAYSQLFFMWRLPLTFCALLGSTMCHYLLTTSLLSMNAAQAVQMTDEPVITGRKPSATPAAVGSGQLLAL